MTHRTLTRFSAAAALLLPLAAAFFTVGKTTSAEGRTLDGVTLVRAEPVTPESTPVGGEPFDLGIRLRMAHGWHVYWQYPGDTGLPTTVAWTLPPGYTASALRFPTPISFTQPGEIVGYGYEDEVLLLTTITPPSARPDESPSVPPMITADVTWLVCAHTCVPGEARLTFRLDDPVIADDMALAEGRERLPASTPGDVGIVDVSNLTDTSEPGSTRGVGTFTVTWAPDVWPREVQWFPLVPAWALGGPVRTNTVEGRTHVAFDYEILDPAGRQQWEGVLAYVDSDGSRRGVRLTPEVTTGVPN